MSNKFFTRGVNEIVPKTLNSDKRFVIHQGGTSSGKTYGLMQCALVKAITEPGCRVLVVGQDIPNLKRGAMQDFESILDADPHLKHYIKQFHTTDRIYYFHNGSKIMFNSFETQQQAKSGKREYSFFNEANGIPYEIYWEISIRTYNQIWIDFNPNSEFWVHDRVWQTPQLDENGQEMTDSEGNPILALNPKAILYKTTWRNNRRFLPQELINEIELLKHKDPMKYRIYGLGEVGQIEGLVFTNVTICKEWPNEFWENPHKYHVNQGLDFGFSTDPTAMIRSGVTTEQGRRILYVDELFYGRGIMLDNNTKNGITRKGLKTLVKENTQKGTYVFADSARPETIAELVAAGCSVRKANKKPGSILSGLEMLQAYDEIRVTERSVNIRKEFNNYSYGKDRDGNNQVMPIDAFNHCIDALRYSELMRKYIKAQIWFTINPQTGQYSKTQESYS